VAFEPNWACPGDGSAGFWANTVPRKPQDPTSPDDEAVLTADIIALALQCGCYGYRRIAALLREADWRMKEAGQADPAAGRVESATEATEERTTLAQ